MFGTNIFTARARRWAPTSRNAAAVGGLADRARVSCGCIHIFAARRADARAGQESRLSPLEFVETWADLYESAHASPAAVGMAYQRFRTVAFAKTGVATKAKFRNWCTQRPGDLAGRRMRFSKTRPLGTRHAQFELGKRGAGAGPAAT